MPNDTVEMTPPHPLRPFVRASSLHIGAAAAAASLRHDLGTDYGVTADEIDRAFAVSRLTPGTNMLALYAVLGHRLGGWRLAIQAVAVGVFLPAAMTLLLASAYAHSDAAIVAGLMRGARAGAVAVFVGSAVRLLRPQFERAPRRTTAFTVVVAAAAWTLPVNLFIVLLGAGVAGAVVLRPR